ncbi:MAG: hypothetical protein V1644_03540 [Candidatus Micrarchaeota archaeon]
MFIPRYTASAAWALPQGESEQGSLKVVRDRKMTVVRKKADDGRVFIVVYPKVEDAKHFERAAEAADNFGPAVPNPEAIGTLVLSRRLDGVYGIDHIQGHSKTSGESPLSRGLIAKYRGWRIRALIEAIELYPPQSRHTIRVNLEGYIGRESVVSDIREACRRTNAILEEHQFGHIIRRKIA